MISTSELVEQLLLMTLIFEAVYFLKLCPIFVSSFQSFTTRYKNKLKVYFWSVVKVLLSMCSKSSRQNSFFFKHNLFHLENKISH